MTRQERIARLYAEARRLMRAAAEAGDADGYQVMRAEARRLRAALAEGQA